MDKPLVFREVAAPDHNPPETDFGSEALERLYLDHRRGLIEAAVGECAEYLEADDWTDEGVFPYVGDMTGEWYLASVGVADEGGIVVARMYLHFLGKCPVGSAPGEVGDYLGVEATFVCDPDRGGVRLRRPEHRRHLTGSASPAPGGGQPNAHGEPSVLFTEPTPWVAPSCARFD